MPKAYRIIKVRLNKLDKSNYYSFIRK